MTLPLAVVAALLAAFARPAAAQEALPGALPEALAPAETAAPAPGLAALASAPGIANPLTEEPLAIPALAASVPTVSLSLPAATAPSAGARAEAPRAALERLATRPSENTSLETASVSSVFDGAAPAAAPEPRAGSGWMGVPAFIGRGRMRWPAYLERHRAAASPAVDDPAGFFAATHDIGKVLGTYTSLGTKISWDATARQARATVARYFPGNEDAFDRFLDRVARLHPASNTRRKEVTEALWDASVRPAGSTGEFFDSLAPAGAARDLRRFRRLIAPSVLPVYFKWDVLSALRRSRETPDGANVVGVLVTGSYLMDSARPDSDLDVMILTRDGTTRGVREFLADLESRRGADRWPILKDLQRFPNAYRAAGPEIRKLADEFPHEVYSLEPEIAAALSFPPRRPHDRPTLRERLVDRVLERPARALLRVLLSRD